MSDSHSHAQRRAKPVRLQPQVVPAVPGVRAGGLTIEVMLFGVLLVLPALWHSLIEGDLPLSLVLERYVFIVIGCAILSSLLHRYSESNGVITDRLDRLDLPAAPARPARTADLPAPAESLEPMDAPPDPFGFGEPQLTAEPPLDLGSLDDLDALDLLPPEEDEGLTRSFSLFDE